MDFHLASYTIKHLQCLSSFIFVITVSFVIKTTGNYLALTSVILKTLTLTTLAMVRSQDLCGWFAIPKNTSDHASLTLVWSDGPMQTFLCSNVIAGHFTIWDLWKLHLGFRIEFEQNHNFNAPPLGQLMLIMYTWSHIKHIFFLFILLWLSVLWQPAQTIKIGSHLHFLIKFCKTADWWHLARVIRKELFANLAIPLYFRNTILILP